uniref:Uncharacterized protein n=1 Tax=Oryza brachyantha TaxID=4533 RepID=J3MF88_ORYBR
MACNTKVVDVTYYVKRKPKFNDMLLNMLRRYVHEYIFASMYTYLKRNSGRWCIHHLTDIYSKLCYPLNFLISKVFKYKLITMYKVKLRLIFYIEI